AAIPSVLVSPLVAKMVATLVSDELGRLVRDRASARTRDALLCVSPRTAALARHPLLPDPLCPLCAALPEDTAEGALIPGRAGCPSPIPACSGSGSGTRQAELERL